MYKWDLGWDFEIAFQVIKKKMRSFFSLNAEQFSSFFKGRVAYIKVKKGIDCCVNPTHNLEIWILLSVKCL